MKSDDLQTELIQAEEAELQSDEQLQKLIALIDRTAQPDSAMSAGDCHKLVAAALDLNTRLKARTDHLRKSLKSLEFAEGLAARRAAST